MNNFNLIAPVYEWLKTLVFGNVLHLAERHFCHLIEADAHVLIVGGGHGKILKHLPQGCQVHYLEYSSTMIEFAKKNASGRDVRFIHGDFLTVEFGKQYDWVLANFFLDVFNPVNLQIASDKTYRLLRDSGQMLVTDFSPMDKTSGKMLLWIMHQFFRITARLESNRIQPIKKHLQQAGYELQDQQDFMGGKVFSAIFKKNGNLSN